MKAFPYWGKRIVFATMHKKEKYIQDDCQRILGAYLDSLQDKINTDQFGTFSGEKDRVNHQKETALQKCHLGLEITNSDLGLASEGSFGPHPMFPYIPFSTETLVFVDKEKKLTLFENLLTLETNYQHKNFFPDEDFSQFLKSSLFPSHAVIVRPHVWEDTNLLFKGIQDLSVLEKAIKICSEASPDQKFHIETDMRAHKNPTRGKVIQKVAVALFQKLNALCPGCRMPGWGRSSFKKGKPCADCGEPTEIPNYEIWSCAVCSYSEEKEILDHNPKVDPKDCHSCNP